MPGKRKFNLPLAWKWIPLNCSADRKDTQDKSSFRYRSGSRPRAQKYCSQRKLNSEAEVTAVTRRYQRRGPWALVVINHYYQCYLQYCHISRLLHPRVNTARWPVSLVITNFISALSAHKVFGGLQVSQEFWLTLYRQPQKQNMNKCCPWISLTKQTMTTPNPRILLIN